MHLSLPFLSLEQLEDHFVYLFPRANLFMMLGYANGGYLMARTTPLLVLGTMMSDARSGAADLTTEDEAKTDDLRQA